MLPWLLKNNLLLSADQLIRVESQLTPEQLKDPSTVHLLKKSREALDKVEMEFESIVMEFEQKAEEQLQIHSELKKARDDLKLLAESKQIRIDEMKATIESQEGYKLRSDRQTNQFTYTRFDGWRVYVLILTVLGAYLWSDLKGSQSQTLGTILAAAVGGVISAFTMQIQSVFSSREKEEVK